MQSPVGSWWHILWVRYIIKYENLLLFYFILWNVFFFKETITASIYLYFSNFLLHALENMLRNALFVQNNEPTACCIGADRPYIHVIADKAWIQASCVLSGLSTEISSYFRSSKFPLPNHYMTSNKEQALPYHYGVGVLIWCQISTPTP